MRSIWLQNVVIAAFAALGAIGATVVPASAHYTTTRCDSDGDNCYTVRCDDDGDDCRRVSSYPRDSYDRRGYSGGYPNGYGSGTSFGLYLGNGWTNGYTGYNGYYGNNGYDNDSFGLYGYEDEDEDE